MTGNNKQIQGVSLDTSKPLFAYGITHPFESFAAILCPICKTVSDNKFQFSFNVSHAMVWCDNVNCKARCVIEPGIFEVREYDTDTSYLNFDKVAYIKIDKLDHDTIQELKIYIDNINKNRDVPVYYESYYLSEFRVFKVRICRINRILDDDGLMNYQSERQANQKDILEFINSNFDQEIADKYGYKIIDNDLQCIDDPDNPDDGMPVSWNMGLIINTYNAVIPDRTGWRNDQKYIDTSYSNDSIIYLECINPVTNKIFCIWYYHPDYINVD